MKNTMPNSEQTSVQMRFNRTDREGSCSITRCEKPSSLISCLFSSKNIATSSSSLRN